MVNVHKSPWAVLWLSLTRLQHFSTKVMPETWKEVEEQLATTDGCTVTIGPWTLSYQTCSYISLTVHLINDNFKPHSLCLQTLKVPQDHDTQSLHSMVPSLFQDWNISDKAPSVTTDNGMNIVNAIGHSGLEYVPCITHTLQLAVRKALQTPKVSNTIARCKKLVQHFKKSWKKPTSCMRNTKSLNFLNMS